MTYHRWVPLVCCAALAACLTASLPAARAAYRGRDGDLVYSRHAPSGHDQIYRIHVNGSGTKRLTSFPADSIFSAWAPNGRLIAFDSDHLGPVEIFIMRPDGTHLRAVTHLPGANLNPDWSPDGTRIVFTHYPQGGTVGSIWTVRADGADPHPITTAIRDQGFPRYSPDGRLILFASTTSAGVPALFLMHSDGTHQHRLTPLRLHAGSGDWSPNGRRIVSWTNVDLPHSVIFTIQPNGRHVHILTSGPRVRNDFEPVFAPSGHRIAFIRALSLTAQTDLWVMRANGHDPHDITNTPGTSEQSPDWGSRPPHPQ